MNSSTESSRSGQTGQILDFAEYRARRAARNAQQAGAQRRFLWGWPAAGQLSVVGFPSTPPTPASFRSHIS